MRDRHFRQKNLALRQRVHDLSAQGHKPTAIKAAIGAASLATVKRWLTMPRPTDHEVASGLAAPTPQVQFKIRLPDDLADAIHAEALRQGTSANRLLTCAAQLYLDCMHRARTKSNHRVNILGYR